MDAIWGMYHCASSGIILPSRLIWRNCPCKMCPTVSLSDPHNITNSIDFRTDFRYFVIPHMTKTQRINVPLWESKADPWIIIKFTAALNQSNIRTIDFTGNTQLGDTFLASFLINLRAPHLRELGLSVLGLTSAARQPLGAYLAAGASRALKILRLNGNALDLAFVDDLLDALQHTNFSLVHVEVFANRLNDRPEPAPAPPAGASPAASVQSFEGAGALPSSLGSSHYSPLAVSSSLPPTTQAVTGSPDLSAAPQAAPLQLPPPPTWDQADRLLRVFFQRNRLYATIAGRQAVWLLRYARALFLRTTSAPESQEYRNTEKQARTNTNTNTGILMLPAELQISILHCIVPVLSPAQCHRVCRYVSFHSVFNLFAPFARSLRVRGNKSSLIHFVSFHF